MRRRRPNTHMGPAGVLCYFLICPGAASPRPPVTLQKPAREFRQVSLE